jgi:hypothetical protein
MKNTDTDQLIFGHTWEQIKRAQRGGRLSDPIDISKPAKQDPTEKDRSLLQQHGAEGLRMLGLFGVLDRLNLL